MDQIVANHRTAAPLVIGLVNSMPGEARRHTEQQFRAILSAAARDVPMELRFFSLEFVPQAEAGSAARYEDMAALEAAAPDGLPDGLIVTGAPPRAARLADEPYWRKLTEMVDLAIGARIPTVWSCLAAHAAVFYLDGIERRRLPQKLSGLIECERTEADHPLMDGLPRRWQVPHSRYNDLPEAALHARGYQVLSRSAVAGADIFAKDVGAPFLFCQGHPEYDAHALLREYRRDIRQFLAGEREELPNVPLGCFGADLRVRLDEFCARARVDRRTELFEAFPVSACAAALEHGWRDFAVGLYANWLAHVAERKVLRQLGPSRATEREGMACGVLA